MRSTLLAVSLSAAVLVSACGASSSNERDASDGSQAPVTCTGASLVPAGSGQLAERDAAAPTSCPMSIPGGSSECGCDGRTCAEGLHCVQIDEPFGPSGIGGGGLVNRCFPTCESDADCASSETCVSNVYGVRVCATPACRTDADCTADPCGQCVPLAQQFHITSLLDPSKSQCAYEGTCAAGSCAHCSSGFGNSHVCGAP